MDKHRSRAFFVRLRAPAAFPICMALLALSIAAPGATIRCAVDRDTLTLGDRVRLTVSLIAPRNAIIAPPETERGFGDFVVKEWDSKKTELAQADSIAFSYTITTYTMKACSIPSLDYVLIQGEQRDTLTTPAMPMTVVSVVTGDTVDIKDLKPQQKAGRPSLLWLWITLALLLIAGLIIGGLWLRRRLRKPPPPPPPTPPYEEAIEALSRLESMNYVKLGRIREYVFGLSEILKRYIERRYTVSAAEFTTDEMLQWLDRSPLLKEDRRRAEWFFRNTDPVKFAKHIPDDATLHRFAEEVRAFLVATRPAAMLGESKPPIPSDASPEQPNAQYR